MQSILSNASYNSFAAPLIKEKVISNFITSKTKIVINNLSSKHEFTTLIAPHNDGVLKLVWFSQQIDYNRGLQNILTQLDTIAISFTLTLIGNCRSNFFDAELKHRHYVYLLEPLSQKALNHQLSNYHIGLAVEDANADDNRNICLTNKIWSYLQAGLYVIATPTKAQLKLAEQYHKQILLLHEVENIQILFNQVTNNSLANNRIHFFNGAQHNLNCEQESNTLAVIWNS